MKKSNYVVLDYFRIFAAILVVMIHIPPFKSFEIDGTVYTNIDFFISHVLARIAVPFFFIASGFFLFNSFEGWLTSLEGFIKKVLESETLYTKEQLIMAKSSLMTNSMPKNLW